MKNYRTLRVGSLIREELGKIIIRELEFPNSLVTITGVDVSEKMEWATVKVSVVPSKETEKAKNILEKNKKQLQFLLTRKINIMPMPKIRFEIDHGPEHAAKIEKILLEDNNKETAQ